MKRIFVLALVATLATASATSTLASLIYHVTDLGPGFANGINSKGQVVGTLAAGGTDSIFLYSNGTRTNIGQWANLSTVAVGIGDGGQIIGFAPGVSFIYTNGVMTSLSVLGQGKFGVANAINPSGEISGDDSTGNAAILSNGIVTHLGNLGGSSPGENGIGQAINSAGLVAGFSYIPYGNGSTAYHAFLYNGTKMLDLGTLANSVPSAHSTATSINDLGQVVGASQTSVNTDPTHAFLYSNGTMTDLGTLPTFTNSQAAAINNHGQIVGSVINGFGHAFLYSDGVMKDLNNLLDSSGVGWQLNSGIGINDNGWIAVSGATLSGQPHALLLTPVPEPSSLNLIVFGAVIAVAFFARPYCERQSSAR